MINPVVKSSYKCVFLAAFLSLATAWMGCSDEESMPVSPPPILEVNWDITLPNLVFQSAAYYPIRVIVGGVNPDEIDSVKAQIENPAGLEAADFRLYDDAGAFENGDALDFCSPNSGDLVSHDGRFSRMVNAHFAAEEGLFTFRVTAWTAIGTAASSKDSVLVSQSAPPQLSNLNLPDTLYSGFAPFQLSLTIIDPDPPQSDSVASAEMKLYSPAGELLGDPTPLQPLGSSLYGTTLTSALPVGLSGNFYTFAFRAWDTFNMESDSIGKLVYLENLAPYLTDFVLPDTITLPPPGDTTYFPILVRCWDDQTVADILEVSIQALKPDMTFGSVVELLDDGDVDYSGDEIAGDSIYTRIVSIYPSNDLGLYQFYFRGEDKAGNQSEFVDSLWVVTP